MSRPLFTVFTPTYNRAHTLDRVYQSLLAQTFKDFEWLIVDDGSTDDTAALVHGFKDDGRLAIRYLQQPNGGKHVAFNRGVKEAHGELFLPLDSDDSCVPIALERFRINWLSIPEAERDNFSGITCLCMNEVGELVGEGLPASFLDGYPYEVASYYFLLGEKWGFHTTDILKMYPFPLFENERFVPEGLIWNRIGKKYKKRFINEALRVYFNSDDGLSTASVRIRNSSPCATCLYYAEEMSLPMRFVDRIRAAANFWRFSIKNNIRIQYGVIRQNKITSLIGLPIGIILAIRDTQSLTRR
jgi:glycosyltransferase involved in cell wall biosynthesis